jgi:hypothetical protein
MSQKRKGPRSPADVQADIERAPDQNRPGANPLQESLAIVQHARELEVRRGRGSVPLPEGAFALQRLLIALLDTLTPEQRAEVRRRLGE